MTKYKVTNGSNVVEFADETSADNYALINGGSVSSFEEDTNEHAYIPDVTPRQIRQALILSGITIEQVDTALDALPEPTRSLAKTEWEYSISFQRDRPLVASVGQMLGWTSQQLDDLWNFARTL
jgi:hypothetical protein